ncbi:23546_t:CDS:1 [Entrophospora sp. SA101]|nr:3233_t:CDS:1 [Entrophospora sp. SA101]CAJ0747488.1 23546_t:CDS:1 [Entrophospora sp. SA101]CAJ0843129.1 14599_t:CDS:1 [Entrophospora sp. SA101]
MPELPEVENVRRTLIKAKTIKQTIQKVEIYNNKLIKGIEEKEFVDLLLGQTIHNIERKGKYLFFILDTHVLVNHLRMTGKYFLEEKLLSPHHKRAVYLTFHLSNQQKLIYSDLRGFGIFHLQPLTAYQKLEPYKKIGKDLLNEEIDPAYLFEYYQKDKSPIKITLLEQDIISGIGNIYASEILFAAKIHPLKITQTLTFQEVERILNFTKAILQKATELGGTSVVDFVNPLNQIGQYQQELRVYGRARKPCFHCANLIEQIKLNGRSTFFCSQCQAV